MATFTSAFITNLARRPLVLPRGAADVQAQESSVTVPVTHASGDFVKLGVLPANCAIVDCYLVTEELDTHGTDTLAYDFGVLNAAENGLVASTKLVSAGKMEVAKVQRINAAEGLLNIGVSDADRTLAVLMTFVAATKAAGKVECVLTYRPAIHGA